MATKNTSSSNPRPEKMGDVLDALSSGIAKTAANEPKFEPQHLVSDVPPEPKASGCGLDPSRSKSIGELSGINLSLPGPKSPKK